MRRSGALAGLGAVSFGVLTFVALLVANPPGGSYSASDSLNYMAKGHRAAVFIAAYLAALSLMGLVCLLAYLRDSAQVGGGPRRGTAGRSRSAARGASPSRYPSGTPAATPGGDPADGASSATPGGAFAGGTSAETLGGTPAATVSGAPAATAREAPAATLGEVPASTVGAGADGGIARLLWGLGLAAAAAFAVGWSITLGVALAGAYAGHLLVLAPSTVYLMSEVGFVTIFGIGSIMLGLALLSLTFGARGALPEWLRWLTVVAGIAAIASTAFFPFFLVMIWAIVIGVWLLVSGGSVTRAT